MHPTNNRNPKKTYRKDRGVSPTANTKRFNVLGLLGATVAFAGSDRTVIGEAYVKDAIAVVPLAGLGSVPLDQIRTPEADFNFEDESQ